MQTRLLALETVALGGLPEIGGLASSTKGSVYDVTGDESGDPVQALLGFTVSYSSANSTPSCGPAFAVIGPSGRQHRGQRFRIVATDTLTRRSPAARYSFMTVLRGATLRERRTNS